MVSNYPAAEPGLRLRRLWLCIGWLLVFSVAYASLAPVSVPTTIEHGDKFAHTFAYGALMGWFSNLYATPSRRWLLAVALVAMGMALEVVQGWTGYRTFDVADMGANAGGVAAGWLLAPPRLPNVLRLIEQQLRRPPV